MKPTFYVLFLFLSLGISNNLFAVNRFWTGNTNTDWNTATNWNPVGVPTASDYVYVNDGTGSPVIASGTTVTIRSINISGRTLTINAGGILNLRGDGAEFAYLQIGSNSTVNNNGTIAVESAAGGSVPGYIEIYANAQLNNSGLIRANCSTGYDLQNSGNIVNQNCGQIRLAGLGIYSSIGSFINNGYLQTNFCQNVTNNGVIKYESGGLAATNNGSVRVNDNPTNSTIFTYQGTYSGTINGIYTNAAGTTSAGSFTAPNTFTPSVLPTGSQTLYAKITPSGGGCTYIVPFTYTYVAPPNFTTDPTTKTVCSGSGTTFTVAASGSPTYQWQVNTGSGTFNNLSNSTPYSGVTGTTLTISNVAGLNGYQYRCVATNAGGSDNSNSATLTVSTVTVTNPTTTTATQGTAFSQTFTASGGTTPRSFSVASGSLPTGLSLNTTTGVVSGTPTQNGSFPITVRVTDANGCSEVSATYTLVVNSSVPTISGFTTLDNTVCVGIPITFTATVGNVTGGYAYTLTNSSSTSIAGTASSTSFSQNLTASGSGAQSFTLIVNDNSQSTFATTNVTINSSPTANLTNNGPLSCTLANVTLTASGGTSYTFANGSGTVLTGSGATRSVTTSGTYSVSVANASGCVSTTSTTVISNTATVSVTNPPTTTATQGTAFSQTFTASGGTTPRSFSVASGSLPTGLSLNTTTGVVSGTPTQNGSFPITVRVTDANGCSEVSATYTLVVNSSVPTISGFTTLDNTVCVGIPITFTATVGNVTGGYAYTLTNSSSTSIAGTASSTSFSQNLTASGSGAQSFTLIVNDNSQSTFATTNVTVNSLPVPSVTTNFGGTLTCAQTSLTISVSGGSYYAFARQGGGGILSVSGVIPDGMLHDGFAIVNASGVYSITTTVASTGCSSVTSTTVFSNTATVTITNPVTTTATTGIAFSQAFTASGGVTPRSFSVASGSLPTGLSLNTTTGVVSGTPTQSGSFSITVRATDANGCSGTSATYTLVVSVACTNLYTVTNTNDAGAGSLRQAMLDIMATTCPAPFTITVTASGTINLASVLPEIVKDIAFIGPGANSLTVRRNSSDNFRIFHLHSDNKTVSFNGFTIADGSSNIGPGIANDGDGSTLTVTNCTIQNNQSTDLGSIYNYGSLIVTNCLFTGNTSRQGGGIYHEGTQLIISNSTFTNNSTTVYGGGIYSRLGNTTITNSLFTGNQTNGQGAAITFSGNATLTNCTISNNRADSNGGGIASFSGSQTLINTTITSNTGNIGGVKLSGDLTLINCIVAGNISIAGPQYDDIENTVNSASTNNVIGTGGTGGLTDGVNGNRVGVKALLAPLGNYGGPRQTHALLPGSPAINIGTTVGAPATDDRGISRVGLPDAGSFESRGFTTALSSGNNQSATVNTAFASPLVVTVSSANSEPVAGGVVTFTGPGSGASINPASGTASIGTTTASRVITANATAGGPYSVTANANGATPNQTFNLTNTSAAPTIAGFTTLDNTVCVGSPISFTATVGNVTGSYNFTVTNGTSTTTGTSANTAFSQNLTASGSGSQTFTLTINDNSQSASATTNVTVNSLPTAGLTNNGPLSCTLTSVTLTATGGNSYSFANGSGTVLTGSGATRSVTTAGTYSVSVANASGCVSTTSSTVISNTATVSVTNPTTTTATQGTAFSQTFSASGGVTPRSFSLASGSLPTGLNLSTSGTLSGTPTQSGSFAITVRATDANGCSGVSATYTLVVTDPTPTLAGLSASPNPVCVGSPVTFTTTVGNLTGSYAYTLTNGSSTSIAGTSSNASFSQNLTAIGSGVQSFTLLVSANGQLASASTSVTISVAPNATIAYMGSPFLTNGSPVNVNQTGTGGGAYSVNPTGLSLNASTGQITPASSSPGTYTVTYTVAASGGCSSFTTTTVLAIQAPAPQTADVSVGMSSPASGVPGGSVSYTITVANAGPNDAANVQVTDILPNDLTITMVTTSYSNGTIAADPPTNNTVRATIPLLRTGDVARVFVTATIRATAMGNLSNTATVTASTADPVPANNSATATSSLTPRADLSIACTDGQNSVQAGSPLTYTLVVANSGPSSVTGATVTDNFPSSLTGITWTASGAGGGAVAASGSGNLNELVNLPVGGSVTFLVTATLSASATGSLINTAIVTVPNSVTDTNLANNSATDTDAIIPITPTISGFTAVGNSVCVGSPVTFTATVGNVTGSYNYTLTNGLSAPLTGSYSNATFSQNLTASGSGVQSFTLTVSANGQLASTTTNATVNSQPVAGLVSSGALSCAITSVTLTASGGSSYTFTNGGGVVGTPGSVSALAVSTPGAYSVTVANASGCISTTSTTVISATGTVTVSNPVTTTATLTTAFSQSFTASGGAGPYSYSLVSGSLPNGLSLNASNGVLSGTPTISGSFPLTVRATDANGCSGISATYTLVVIDPAPTVTGLAASSNVVCIGSPVTFTASVGNVSGSYTYTLTSGSSTTTGSSSAATFSQVLVATGSGEQSVVLVVRANGQSASTNTSLIVNSLPVAGLVSSGILTCAITSVTLTASGGTSYTFTNSSGVLGVPGSASTLVVGNAGSYSVTVANDNGCVSVTSLTVEQDRQLPTPSLTNNGPLSCSLTSVTLTAGGGATYLFGNGATPLGANLARVTSAGVYSVTVVSANGCTNVASTTVTGSSQPPTTPALMASATTTLNQPISITAVGCTGSLDWIVVGGSGTASGGIYTLTNPGNYTLSAQCSLNGCTSPATSLTLSIQASGELQLIQPGYDCQTGALTFRTQGGDGTPIEFFAIGVTGWTTNPNQFVDDEILTSADLIPIRLIARQSGREVTYDFDWRASCPLVSDLTPTLYVRPFTTYGSSAINLVVDVVELNRVATNGLITIKITRDAKVALSLPASATSVGGRVVQNSVWQLTTSDPAYYVLTTNQVIKAGDKLSVGLTGVISPGETTGILSISSVLTGVAGEQKVTNNADADKVEYFPR
ncbi:putative Ig domain-containing protein [Spirosoma validum]|uniref:Ig domain-containing protein n=1 Tax=Spirosoma validum TaxID=2771355 RepID=A0A927GH66_9BACT|nr:putative Ig domain-containing protein [Spirosoma validum]MBD2757433.1 putative Ig domain-containing protein [Spirosoma validum]